MKQSSLSKIILSLAIISFTVWLGSYVARQLVVYQLFEPINLDLKNLYNAQNLTGVLETIFPILMLNLISYPAFLILYFVFIINSKIKIKNEGWLFIILMLVIITAPFELYLSFFDFKIVKLLYESTFDSNSVVDLLRKRITALSSFPMIEVFSYCAAIFLAIFKPLRKNEN